MVKATGDGLHVDLRAVRVSPAAEPARLVSYPDRPDLAATLTDLRPGAGYAGALAVLRRRITAGFGASVPESHVTAWSPVTETTEDGHG